MSEAADLTARRRRSLARDWPEASLEAERKFGQRVARLYPLIGLEGGVQCYSGFNRVGQGTLIAAYSHGCRVLLTGDRTTAKDKNGKERRVTRDFPVEAISPSNAGRMKGAR